MAPGDVFSLNTLTKRELQIYLQYILHANISSCATDNEFMVPVSAGQMSHKNSRLSILSTFTPCFLICLPPVSCSSMIYFPRSNLFRKKT